MTFVLQTLANRLNKPTVAASTLIFGAIPARTEGHRTGCVGPVKPLDASMRPPAQ